MDRQLPPRVCRKLGEGETATDHRPWGEAEGRGRLKHKTASGRGETDGGDRISDLWLNWRVAILCRRSGI